MVFILKGFIFFCWSLGSAWAGLALWVHLQGISFALSFTLFLLSTLATGLFFWSSSYGLSLCLLLISIFSFGYWYQGIEPRQDRHWAVELSRGAEANLEDNDIVELRNIRDFDWLSEDEARHNWRSQSLDLTQLKSVDVITSVWSSPKIAHLLVSFGFEQAPNSNNLEHVVFSIEIRREHDEAFSQFGGFVRQFELILIAATERDVIKLRTDHRQEDVRLYPLNLTEKNRRELFLGYIALAQRLKAAPEFYNTISANCTTAVYPFAKKLKADLPFNWQLLFSGHLAKYLEDLGVLGGEGSLAARQAAAGVTPFAEQHHPDKSFSQAIRQKTSDQPVSTY